MGRIRSIKPEFPHSESMGRVSRDARLLFILLWGIVDDSGRARASSRMLASLLFPYDNDAPALLPGWLAELENEEAVRLYIVDGDRYLDIPNWSKHQKIDKASPPKFPAFDEGSRIVDESSRPFVVGLDQGSGIGSGIRDQGSGRGSGEGTAGAAAPVGFAEKSSRPVILTGDLSASFERFWVAYDYKKARANAERAWRRIAPDAALVDQIVAAAKIDRPELRKHPATWLNAACWEDEPDKTRSIFGGKPSPLATRVGTDFAEGPQVTTL